jgi:hypothetical protein
MMKAEDVSSSGVSLSEGDGDLSSQSEESGSPTKMLGVSMSVLSSKDEERRKKVEELKKIGNVVFAETLAMSDLLA